MAALVSGLNGSWWVPSVFLIDRQNIFEFPCATRTGLALVATSHRGPGSPVGGRWALTVGDRRGHPWWRCA
jgi:hypothetical protein